jgi:sorting nexin-1/2
MDELEHNPFADVVSPNTASQADNPLAPASPEQQQQSPESLQKMEGEPPAPVEKERTSSVLNTKTPVEVDVPRAASSDDFEIQVHDPQTVGDRLKQHTTYSITTRTTSPLFKSNQATVQRRFKEFIWLYQQLLAHNPGVIVPPVPEKHALGIPSLRHHNND